MKLSMPYLFIFWSNVAQSNYAVLTHCLRDLLRVQRLASSLLFQSLKVFVAKACIAQQHVVPFGGGVNQRMPLLCSRNSIT